MKYYINLVSNLVTMFVYSYVEKCNTPTLRFNMYKADLNSLFNSVEWDEALRDFDIDSAWMYFSSKVNSFIKEYILMLVQKRKKICMLNGVSAH